MEIRSDAPICYIDPKNLRFFLAQLVTVKQWHWCIDCTFSRIAQPQHTLRSAAVDRPACVECDNNRTVHVHELRERPRRAEPAGVCKDTKLIKMQTKIQQKCTLCGGLLVNLVAVRQKFGV